TRWVSPMSGVQGVVEVVGGVGEGGLPELQRHDHQDGDEGQDEGILHHALALFGALTQPGHQGLRGHDLLGYELAHEWYLQELYLSFCLSRTPLVRAVETIVHDPRAPQRPIGCQSPSKRLTKAGTTRRPGHY